MDRIWDLMISVPDHCLSFYFSIVRMLNLDWCLMTVALCTCTPHHYAYFTQFDRLEEKFYTSINSMRRNLETIFLHPALNCAIVSTKIRF